MSLIQSFDRGRNPSVKTVVFLLQPHFSLLAFTAAADALTTANLVIGQPKFSFKTLSVNSKSVVSDLGIPICCDYSLHKDASTQIAADDHPVLPTLDLLIVCGGFRCELEENTGTTALLCEAHEHGVMLGGLWNGIFAVAHAGLMSGHSAAIHFDNIEQAENLFPSLELRKDTLVIDRKRVSAAGPNSAFDLMLLLIQRYDTIETVQAIRDILRADTGSQENVEAALQKDDERRYPASLRNALQLMRGNLDQPVSKQMLSQHINISTRAMERLFQRYLQTSPAKHYMRLRLQSAYELLKQTDQSIGEISDACGFISSAHFSRTFSQQYGLAPSALRKSPNQVLDV